MPRVRIDLCYDGSGFCGWQLQKNDPSIQGAIEKALYELTGTETRVTGSGRTDSGVHATQQTAHFDTEARIPPQKFTPALNSLLPSGVRLLRSSEVSPEFHSRFSARKRIYRYYILPGTERTPFNRLRALATRRRPDTVRLNRMASCLVGEHDFTTFAAAGDPSESKIRTIHSATFFPQRDYLIFEISGNAFLWRMVRSLVGTLLSLDESGESSSAMSSILAGAQRNLAGATAPPEALYLYKVCYNENDV